MHQFDRATPLNRVRAILAGAIILPEQERARFIKVESGGDQAIVSEVQSLLSLNGKAEAFFGNCLGELIPVAPKPEQLNCGDLLKDRYRISEKIAQSNFSTVYLAHDELLLGKRVVIKTPDQISTENEMRLTFMAEFHALSELHHPNIAGINDIGVLSSGKPFLVLNFVPGQTLAELLSRGPLPRPLTRQISEDLAKALAAAHRSGIFHLDVKPSNVVVYGYGTKDQHVTLIDFGIAKLKNSGSPQFFAGSLDYMAPEQAQLPSAKCDIYSLGLLIFEMLTGRLPSSSRSISAQLPRDLDRTKRDLLSKAIDADPLQRPDNAVDFIGSLWHPRRVSRFILIPAAAAALVFAVIAFVRPGIEASRYSKPAPLVSTLARELFPSLSADGSQVYYVVQNGQQSVICKRLVIGGEPEIISVSPLRQYFPKPSNSGKYLVWIRSKQDGKMQLLGKVLPAGPEDVIADSLDVDDFTWTPDDRYLILSTREGPHQELRRLDLETRNDRGLSLPGSPACGTFHPAVSRDGQSLAFACRWRRGSDDLFTAKPNKDWSALGELKQVTHIGERINSLQWVPGGTSILYIAGPLGHGTLRRIWVDNPSRIESLPEMGDRLHNISVASKAWKAAFGRDLSDTNLLLHSTSNKDRPIRIAESSYPEDEGSWSPDGTRMAFSSLRSGSQQLWVADANGKEAKQVTHINGADSVGGMWTPDLKELVVSITDGNGSRIGLISPISGTHMKDVYKGGVPLSFSQDGRWIYVLKQGTGQEIGQEVWRLPFPGGGAPILVQKPAGYALESPDGRFLYFSAGHEVWRRPMAGGPAKLVLRQILRRSLFSLSSKGIYFVAPPEGPYKYPSLRFRDNQGNSAIISQLAQSIGWGMSLSPDEGQIMLTHAEIDNDDIMLIEQFR